MKRVDMVDIMCSRWDNMSNKWSLEQRMDFLLETIEAAGMEPPLIEFDCPWTDENGMIHGWEE